MDFSKERYSSLKAKPAVSSISRIEEFRKKLEHSFASKPEFRSSPFNYNNSPRLSSLTYQSQIPRPYVGQRLSKNSSVMSMPAESRKKMKLPEIIPLETLIEAKRAYALASEKELESMPYMYNFALSKLCGQIDDKIRD